MSGITPSASPPPGTTICRYYQQAGKCFYGAECKFIHSGDVTPAPTESSTIPTSNQTILAPTPQPTTTLPRSNLAACAKEWTPSSSSIGSVPAPATTSSSSSTTTPVKSSPTNATTTKLNPNKTPFKPTSTSASTGGMTVAASAWNSVPEFVPASISLLDSQHLDDSSQYDLSEHDPDAQLDASLLHPSHQAHLPPLATPSAFVHPPYVMAPLDFAASVAPVGGAFRSPIPASTSSSAATIGGQERERGSIFMDDALRTRLIQWTHLQMARLQPDDPTFANLPITLDHDRYHSLMPLTPDPPPKGLTSSYAKTAGGSVSYKVTSAADGRSYVVKRLQSCRFSEDRARDLLQPWFDFAARFGAASKRISPLPVLSRTWGAGACHPTVIAPRGVFTTKDFADITSVVCLVYDYHPTAAALHPSQKDSNLPLETVWIYVVQLVTAIAAIHEAGLSAGEMLKPGRVLVTSDQRLHLSCCGLPEVVAGALPSDSVLTRQQHADFTNLARLILGWLGYAEDIEGIDELGKLWTSKLKSIIDQQFAGGELTSLLTLLLTTPKLTATQVQVNIIHRLTQSYTTQLSHTDFVENEMAKEVQNGRLFRLLVKFGFVTERPDGTGSAWSETGDRYLLSLFRDLVFHSQHSLDVPNMDWGHVIHQLNKLDAGVDEKLLLSSRNGESMLLVRYTDLKRCIEESYAELLRKQAEGFGSHAPSQQQPPLPSSSMRGLTSPNTSTRNTSSTRMGKPSPSMMKPITQQ